MGIYSGIGNAKMSDRLPNLTEGRYVLEIDRVICKDCREVGLATIVEVTVVETDGAKGPDGRELHPVGSKRSYFQKMKVDAALGALKEFASAVAGVDPKDAARVEKEIAPQVEEIMNSAISSENPMRGSRVGVEIVNIKTKKGLPFGRHSWFPVAQA